MKIILIVDYKSSEFNKDFRLANDLIKDHSVFLVTNVEQLKSAEPYYDLILIGYSINLFEYNFTKRYYKIKNSDTIAEILNQL